MKNNSVLITVIVAVVVAAAAFFGGMQYQKSHVTQTAGMPYGMGNQAFRGANGQGGMGGRRGGFGGATLGEVASIDANSITIKLQDGSSKIVDLSGSTTYSKTSTATQSDVKVGDRIAAFGTANSDGSITAQNVQLNPAMNMFRGRPSGSVTGQPVPTKY